ncbi:MAG: acyltransferase [Niabella sp.]
MNGIFRNGILLIKKINMVFYKIFVMRIFYKYQMPQMGKNVFIARPIKITPQFLFVDNNVYIAKNCRLEGVAIYEGQVYNPSIRLGENVSIQQSLHLTCASSIVLEKDVAIAANVTITDIEHPYIDISIPIEKQHLSTNPVLIKSESKVYNNAVILPGTIIGKHSVVGANSILSGVFPDYCVIVGAPAYIVKRYCFESNLWRKTDKTGNFID